MWIIYITLIAMLAMARKPRRRRRMGRYIRGDVSEALSLGTLAAEDVVGVLFDQVVQERTLCTSVVARYSMTGFTKSTGDGPILVGLAHGDYSDSEIEVWIETTGSWDETDLVQQEVGSRKIRRVGIFDNPVDEAASVTLNDGKPIKTKLNWILTQGQTLRLWAYNLGTSALATTSPRIDVQGHANLFPK